MIAAEKLISITERLAGISEKLTQNPSSSVFVALSKEYAEIEPTAKKAQELLDIRKELEELSVLEQDSDPAVQEMAKAERANAEAKQDVLEKEMLVLLLPKDAADEKSAILELRAGTGGDEAALFAGDLFDMYQRYSTKHGWSVEVMSTSEGSMGGYKEIIASITGRNVYARLKFESGARNAESGSMTFDFELSVIGTLKGFGGVGGKTLSDTIRLFFKPNDTLFLKSETELLIL